MMPFDFRLFRQMFRIAFREAPKGDPRAAGRRRLLWVMAFLLPVWAAWNALCFALDVLLFPGLRRIRVREPVFIVGHARSGTTLLHRLMCADRDRFSWFAMYEMFFPSLLQRKLLRAIGRFDERYLSRSLGRRIEAWEDRAFAAGRKMHPMSLTGPEEDEFLMALNFCSSTVAMLFPFIRELRPYHDFDELPRTKRMRVLRYYRQCVQRQLYLNGGGHLVHLSKNPVFSGKVESLIECFPDARFAVLVRDPRQTIPSLLKLMERNWKATGVSPERIRDSLDALGANSLYAYRHPFEVLERHPETRFAAVDYEQLVAEPKKTVEALYLALELPITEAMQQGLEAEEARSREHRAEHLYSLEEFGLTRAEIEAELSPLFDRFGWARSSPEA